MGARGQISGARASVDERAGTLSHPVRFWAAYIECDAGVSITVN